MFKVTDKLMSKV